MFAVLGEVLVDLVQPQAKAAYSARPGGGPFNIAVGLSRLGHPTALVARLSSRGLGRLVRDHARANEVDLTHCVEVAEPVTLSLATVSSDGQAEYEFYVEGTADWSWTPSELSALPPGLQVLHTGSLATAIAPGAQVILNRVESLHADGHTLVSFDPNIRPQLDSDIERARKRVERFVAAAHLVKASDADLGWLYPDEDPLDVVRRWATSGPVLVALTRGADGCVAVRRSGLVTERPAEPADVIDTIGAGDAFQSGLLSGLADADLTTPDRLATAADDDIVAAIDKAAIAAAMTCERRGADPPTRRELRRRLERS